MNCMTSSNMSGYDPIVCFITIEKTFILLFAHLLCVYGNVYMILFLKKAVKIYSKTCL